MKSPSLGYIGLRGDGKKSAIPLGGEYDADEPVYRVPSCLGFGAICMGVMQRHLAKWDREFANPAEKELAKKANIEAGWVS